MIINCENCNKKFNLNENLIGDNGRLLQCGNCDNTWFYKPLIKNIKKIKKSYEDNSLNISNKKNQKLLKIKKSYNFSNLFLVIIISLISLIIIIDTFKDNISIFIPGTKSFLSNLYETLYDLQLFIKDLFN